MKRSVDEMNIDEVLSAAHKKHGHGGVYEQTAADDLIRKEEADSHEEWAIKVEAFRHLLGYIFAEGPHPGHACRRLYCLAKAFAPELILDLGVRDLGRIFGESHGCWSWRIKNVVHGFVKRTTGQDMQLPYQKSAESSAQYARAQMGNRNRENGERKKRLAEAALRMEERREKDRPVV